jgi:hypothetical protein
MQPHTGGKVLAVGSLEISVVGRVSLSVNIGELCVQHQFTVIDAPGKTVILGRGFQKEIGGVAFDWSNGRIRLGENWFLSEMMVQGGLTMDRARISCCDESTCVGDGLDDERWTVSAASIDESGMMFHIHEGLGRNEKAALLELLQEFDDVFAVNPKRPTQSIMGTHVIEVGNARPIKQPIRRMSPQDTKEVDEQVEEMLANGICHPSCSPWSSGVLLVRKKDGSKRFVIDYRAVNSVTKKDSYPMPYPQDVVDRMHGATIFSTLDGASAYWCIPMDQDSQEITAFSVPRGQFELDVMSFGLANAPATYQRAHDKTTQGLDHTATYVDDACCFSPSFAQHLLDLRELLGRYRAARIQLKKSKCQFGFDHVEFVGFVVSGDGYSPTSRLTDAIVNFPVPLNAVQLQRFLGLVNFYRCFIPRLAEIAQPLYDLTKSGVSFGWENLHQQAFTAMKQGLVSASKLVYPQWDRDLFVETDASKTAIGGVMSQLDESGKLRPLAFFSSGLRKEQQCYSATELETFAVVAAMRKWRLYVEAAPKVHVITDHNPIVWLRKQKDPRGKFARWIIELEAVDYDISYRKGSANSAADALSRGEFPVDPAVLDDTEFERDAVYSISGDRLFIERLKAEQIQDIAIRNAVGQISRSGKCTDGKFKSFDRMAVDDGLLVRGRRIVVPVSMQRDVIRQIHNAKHMGIDSTVADVKESFWWEGLAASVQAFCRACDICQRNKRSTKPKEPMQIMDFGVAEWKPRMVVAMDVATLPWADSSFRNFLVIVCCFSKFVELIPMRDQLASTVANAFRAWVWRHGVPKVLLTDQGSNMDGVVIRDICNAWSIEKRHSSPHHPECDGLAERTVQTSKQIVRCLTAERELAHSHWPGLLAETAFVINSRSNESTKVSPHELFHGTRLRSPADSQSAAVEENEMISAKDVVDSVGNCVARAKANQFEARERMKSLYDRGKQHCAISFGDEVLIDNKYRQSALDPLFVGPFRVLWRKGVNVCIIDSSGNQKVVHLNRVKAYQRPSVPLPVIVDMDHEILPDDEMLKSPTAAEMPYAEPADLPRRSVRQRRPPDFYMASVDLDIGE